jgi:hypothetical protein
VPDLLPLGLRGAPMILSGFRKGAYFMRRRHVGEFIGPSEFQSANVLDRPAVADTMDRAFAQDPDTSRPLPYLQPSVRCELPTHRCAHVSELDERHWFPTPGAGGDRSLGRLIREEVSAKKLDSLLDQTFPVSTNLMISHKKIGECALTIYQNEARLHSK